MSCHSEALQLAQSVHREGKAKDHKTAYNAANQLEWVSDADWPERGSHDESEIVENLSGALNLVKLVVGQDDFSVIALCNIIGDMLSLLRPATNSTGEVCDNEFEPGSGNLTGGNTLASSGMETIDVRFENFLSPIDHCRKERQSSYIALPPSIR